LRESETPRLEKSGMTNKQFYGICLVFLLTLGFSACSTSEPEEVSEPEQPAEIVTPQQEEEQAATADEAESDVTEVDEDEGGDLEEEALEEVAEVDDEKVEPIEPVEKVGDIMDADTSYGEAPAKFRARFETTKGNFVVELVREWAPNGVDHFYHLVRVGYYTEIAFFRAIQGFMVQFGLHGDPKINSVWSDATIMDEPVKASNTRGFVTYAKSGLPNSRSTQLFINLVDNPNLDRMGFSPIGQVVEGMSVVDSLYTGYGEGAPRGRGPSQGLIHQQGNSYLKQNFPNLDYLKKVVILD
jgi:peptidyl-prolyl cis-trans isomerase A (cyclophilin A)